jgi:N-acetylmuramic acid 6-phosphate etherase
VDHLLTEARNPASEDLDRLTPLQIVHLMNAEDSRVAPAVFAQAEPIARGIEVIADRLREGGRLVYVGAGTSGRLGVLDASECPPTFNAPPGQVVGLIAGGYTALTTAVEGAEDVAEAGATDLKKIDFTAKDVLVGIATSGRTPYVQGAIRHAREVGAFTIGLSCNPDSELLALVDLAITPVVGPEVLTGSTRLKAGTATKLVLNMLSTGAMVRLGKAFGNLMVDLRATNVKLRARTNRIVRHFTGLSAEQAAALLQQCGGELKIALVAHRANVSPEEARAHLAVAGGRVSGALERLQPGQQSGVAVTAGDVLLLGIDGGGTSTAALLARKKGDAFEVLGRGESGPSNLHTVGPERTFQALAAAVADAFRAAGVPRQSVAAACFGLAGAGRPAEQALIRDWALAAGVAARVEVTSDVALLLPAGTPAGWGLAVVAGTGSITVGRTADGRTARAGGWGPILGDEGSAYALTMAALRAITQAADGRREPTTLADRLLPRLGVQQPAELIPLIARGGWDRQALASLAPLVLEAVGSGDAVAHDLVEQAARELAETAVAVLKKLGLTSGPIPVALAGGLLQESEHYRQRFLRLLQALGVEAQPVAVVQEPAEGAVRLAAQGR